MDCVRDATGTDAHLPRIGSHDLRDADRVPDHRLEDIAPGRSWRKLEGMTRQEAEFHAQVAASVAWAVYAAALLGSGFLLRRTEFRWTAIVLFGVTLGKVLLYDTARLDAAYRILSFLALGGLLVAASFLYQRKKAV